MCVKCRPSHAPPEGAPGVAAISDRFPTLDWRTPGIGMPLAFASPVRMDWLPVPLRTKAIIDPWCVRSWLVDSRALSLSLTLVRSFSTGHGKAE